MNFKEYFRPRKINERYFELAPNKNRETPYLNNTNDSFARYVDDSARSNWEVGLGRREFQNFLNKTFGNNLENRLFATADLELDKYLVDNDLDGSQNWESWANTKKLELRKNWVEDLYEYMQGNYGGKQKPAGTIGGAKEEIDFLRSAGMNKEADKIISNAINDFAKQKVASTISYIQYNRKYQYALSQLSPDEQQKIDSWVLSNKKFEPTDLLPSTKSNAPAEYTKYTGSAPPPDVAKLFQKVETIKQNAPAEYKTYGQYSFVEDDPNKPGSDLPNVYSGVRMPAGANFVPTENAYNSVLGRIGTTDDRGNLPQYRNLLKAQKAVDDYKRDTSKILGSQAAKDYYKQK